MAFQPDFSQRFAGLNSLGNAKAQRFDLFAKRSQLALDNAGFNKAQKDKRTAQLARFFEIKEQRKAEKKAKKKSSFAGLGGAVGVVAGVAAAPFTGGASLAALPALAGAGGAIGGAVDVFSGQGGPASTQAITQGVSTVGSAFAPQNTFIGVQGFVTQQPTFSNVFLGKPLGE